MKSGNLTQGGEASIVLAMSNPINDATLFTGIADEAGNALATQIAAHRALGWDTFEMRNVQVGDYPNANIHELPEAAFDQLCEELAAVDMRVAAFGSTIANWAHRIEDPFSLTTEKIARAIPRMQRLGAKFIRIMSYAVCKNTDGSDADEQFATERFQRLREIHERFTDAGLTCVHENCMNYGGMGIRYALETLEHVPGLKWVFDTGNPVFNRDRDQSAPVMQDSWSFYQAVKPHIAHLHVKDGYMEGDRVIYTDPGEGSGQVGRIVADLLASGYEGMISIEPHVSVVFHDAASADTRPPEEKAREQFDSYVRYGRKMMELVRRVKAEMTTERI